MYCQYCKNPIPPGFTFCTHCGTPTNIPAPPPPPPPRPLFEQTHLQQDPPGQPAQVQYAQIPAGQPVQQMPAGQPVQQMPAGQPVQQMPAGQPVQQMPYGQPVQHVPYGQPGQQVPYGQPVQHIPYNRTYPTTVKSPETALLLSFLIVGLGQIYNGQTAKGIVMLIASFVLLVPTLSLGTIIIWAIGMIDASKIATKINSGATVGEWEFF